MFVLWFFGDDVWPCRGQGAVLVKRAGHYALVLMLAAAMFLFVRWLHS